jgi:hypothetical protein
VVAVWWPQPIRHSSAKLAMSAIILRWLKFSALISPA